LGENGPNCPIYNTQGFHLRGGPRLYCATSFSSVLRKLKQRQVRVLQAQVHRPLNGSVQSTGADIPYRILGNSTLTGQLGYLEAQRTHKLALRHDIARPWSSAVEVAERLKGHMCAAMAELKGEEIATET
jgi:hypothetical protein